MKNALLSVLCLTTVTACASFLKLDFTTERITSHELRRRQADANDTYSEDTLNQSPGQNLYWINATIGTPGQPFALQLDTGSSDLWVPASTSQACKKDGCKIAGGFNAAKSSTYEIVSKDTFDIEYVDLSHEHGHYFSDVVTIGGATVQNITMGLAIDASEGQGLLGVGYKLLESSAPNYTFPTFVDHLKSAGKIDRAAFSLWLDDIDSNTGSILFGGIDAAKYHGDLVGLPIMKDVNGSVSAYLEYRVDLTAITFNDDSGGHLLSTEDFSTPALLDSGTTQTYLPDDVAKALFTGLGAVEGQGNQFVPCSYIDSNASITYTFGGNGGPQITVPMSELIDAIPRETRAFGNNVPACALLVHGPPSGDRGDVILGDSFLRSAYVVYDLDNNQVAIANTNFNATTEDIQAIPSGTGLPGVSSTATAKAAIAAANTAPPGAASSTAAPSGGGGAAPGTPTFNLGPAATSGNAGSSTGKPKKGAASSTVSEPFVLGFALLSSLACGFGVLMIW